MNCFKVRMEGEMKGRQFPIGDLADTLYEFLGALEAYDLCATDLKPHLPVTLRSSRGPTSYLELTVGQKDEHVVE